MSNLKKKFTVDEEIVWKFEDFDSQGEQNLISYHHIPDNMH